MRWFKSICRNLGLMVHNIGNPDDEDKTKRKIIKKEVEETTEGNLTLRRTTIDEVEIRPDTPSPHSGDEDK
jgi:hypothetical protein